MHRKHGEELHWRWKEVKGSHLLSPLFSSGVLQVIHSFGVLSHLNIQILCTFYIVDRNDLRAPDA